jgi:purine-nucleoside/S-methyl-5'-thioadenosine phosphorylase / adenosine deaminase
VIDTIRAEMNWHESNGVRFIEAALPGATAVFTTRVGGVSAPPFEGLNLGLLTDDDSSAVRENRRRAAAAAGVDADDVLIGYQVHRADVEVRDRPPHPNPYSGPASDPARADGQATARPGLAPLVLVADCLPVALSGSGRAGVLHCGWRGLAAGIVERGVAAVEARAAAIGPGIGPCCYEVGEEVMAAFAGLGDGVAQGRNLDLRAVTRRLLERAGVSAIEVSELCTSCNPDLFFSHRRDGRRTGRQAGLVRITETG